MRKDNIIIAAIIGICMILAAYAIGNSAVKAKRGDKSIQVTGIAERNFESDLVVWSAKFSTLEYNMQEGFSKLKGMRSKVLSYLKTKGIPDSTLTLSSVALEKKTDSRYEGNNYVTSFGGFELSQSVTIESHDLNLIESVSRDITELINDGVEIASAEPQFYYTKLNDLKIKMLQEASEDALNRARVIAEGSKSHVGKLVNSQMGVFQIVGYNSNEDYSWGGAFNTSNRLKTASITVKSKYLIK